MKPHARHTVGIGSQQFNQCFGRHLQRDAGGQRERGPERRQHQQLVAGGSTGCWRPSDSIGRTSDRASAERRLCRAIIGPARRRPVARAGNRGAAGGRFGLRRQGRTAARIGRHRRRRCGIGRHGWACRAAGFRCVGRAAGWRTFSAGVGCGCRRCLRQWFCCRFVGRRSGAGLRASGSCLSGWRRFFAGFGSRAAGRSCTGGAFRRAACRRRCFGLRCWAGGRRRFARLILGDLILGRLAEAEPSRHGVGAVQRT